MVLLRLDSSSVCFISGAEESILLQFGKPFFLSFWYINADSRERKKVFLTFFAYPFYQSDSVAVFSKLSGRRLSV